MPRTYWVYMMTNKPSGTLYIGVTSDLVRRAWEHRQQQTDGFTSRYRLTRLIYFEQTSEVRAALEREKELKGWRRTKKITLIECVNPNWHDLYNEILSQ